MKRLLLFVLLCSSVLLSNCTKDNNDPDPATPQELIIGKWNTTKFWNSGQNLVFDTDEAKSEFFVEFKTGGALIMTASDTDKTVSPVEVNTFTYTGSYSWSGNILTLSYTDSTNTFTVTGTVSVTDKKLVFTATSGDVNFFFDILEADRI